MPYRKPRQKSPELRRHYRQATRLCSGPYFAGPVGGAPITALRQHIEQQNPPVPTGSRPPAYTTGLKADALAAL